MELAQKYSEHKKQKANKKDGERKKVKNNPCAWKKYSQPLKYFIQLIFRKE